MKIITSCSTSSQSERPFLKNEMYRIRHQQQIEKVKNKMKNIYGQHHTILYQPVFNFQEQWETTNSQTPIEKKYSEWSHENKATQILQYLIVVLYSLTLWYISTYRTFKIESINYEMISIGLATQIIDIAMT